jgi:hypothetical protein
MRLHLAQIVLGRRLHWLRGNEPLVEATAWALEALGHTVSRGQNQVNSDAVNIVFGAVALSPAQWAQFPRGTILYNSHKIEGVPPDQFRARFGGMAAFRIWDCSAGNLTRWLGAGVPAKLVPMGHAPGLERPGADPDIDMLFAGPPTGQATTVFTELTKRYLRSMFASGVHGEALDGLIARSRMAMGFSSLPPMPNEAIGVARLLANRKPVIATPDFAAGLPQELREAVIARPADLVAGTVDELRRDPARMAEAAAAGYVRFRALDMRPALAAALEG